MSDPGNAESERCSPLTLRDQSLNPTHVLLYAYQRPELTKQVCLSLLDWPELERIVITIDGLRSSAGIDEREWRQQTIQISLDLAKLDNRIEVRVWDDNPGLTNHILRSISYVLECTDSLIAIEDDNLISVSGLRFLSSRITSNDYPQIAAGFNKSIHPGGSFTADSRKTLFPIQWTTAINQRMFAMVKEVWEDQMVDKSVVANRISELNGINLIQKWRLISYWSGYFKKAMSSPRHTDIVFQYAAFKAGVFFEVPLEDYVDDIAAFDWRGMNERHNPVIRNSHDAKLYSVSVGLACSTCDLIGARIEPSISRQVRNALSTRFRRIHF